MLGLQGHELHPCGDVRLHTELEVEVQADPHAEIHLQVLSDNDRLFFVEHREESRYKDTHLFRLGNQGAGVFGWYQEPHPWEVGERHVQGCLRRDRDEPPDR